MVKISGCGVRGCRFQHCTHISWASQYLRFFVALQVKKYLVLFSVKLFALHFFQIYVLREISKTPHFLDLHTILLLIWWIANAVSFIKQFFSIAWLKSKPIYNKWRKMHLLCCMLLESPTFFSKTFSAERKGRENVSRNPRFWACRVPIICNIFPLTLFTVRNVAD